MKINRSTRRMFLQGSGGTLVSIPFLTSLLPRELWAQSAGSPVRRFISIRSGYDLGHHSSWLPNIGGNFANLGQPSQIVTGINGHHNVRWQNLRDFAPTNSSILAPLYGSAVSPYLESMNIVRGLDFIVRYGHGGAMTLGGVVDGFTGLGAIKKIPTIDHIINNNKIFNPLGRSVINVGGHSGDSSQNVTATGGVANAPNSGYGLGEIYNSLFSNGNYPESGQQAATHPKGPVLNRVLEDYNRLKNSKNISASDKLALENAFDKLSDVQNSLNVVSTASCSHKNFFTSHPGTSIYSSVGELNSTINMKALADLMTAAIMCDTNRVYGVQLGVFGGAFEGQGFDHQVISHEPHGVIDGKKNWQRMCDRHNLLFTNFTSQLVKNLSSATDPSNGKSFLYNSLIYNTMESAQVHGWASHPCVLFGNAGGNLTSGKYIDYSDRTKGIFDGVDTGGDNGFVTTLGDPRFCNNYPGVNYNRLLVTIMQSMGLSASDYENNSLNSQLYNVTKVANIDVGSQNYNLTNLGGYGYVFPVDTTVESWERNAFAGNIKRYDLKQYKYKLPIL